MSSLVRASIAIEADLMERLDALVKASGHSNRSEVVRDLIRAHVNEAEWMNAKEAVATIHLIYDHNKRALGKKVEDFGHQHHDEILSSMHIHLTHDHCLEVVIARGEPAKLRKIADHLIGLKGVLQGQAFFSAMEEK